MSKSVNNLVSDLKAGITKENKTKLLIILGIAGMLLILFSELLKTDDDVKESSVEPQKILISEYRVQVENDLENLLSTINGVGKVKVMVTLEGTTENIYAKEVNKRYESSDGKLIEDSDNQYVFYEYGNNKEPLISKTLQPKIVGIIVVCEGGDSPLVCEKVLKAVSIGLNVSASRVYVTKG